jgi:glutathione synthase/RimK-type ligase-like ATP-grasp enzyme
VRLAFATCAAKPGLTEDDALAGDALGARGAEVEAVPWDDRRADWASFDAVVVRSTWDYYLRLDEFSAWIDRLERDGARLWNPPAVLRENVTKRYLRELEAKGVPTVPTLWLEDPASLEAGLGRAEWAELVIKPVVSAGAFGTERLRRDEALASVAHLRPLAKRGGGLMVQPYLPEVARDGEYSFLFFGGAFSHAVLKVPAQGDFRVQEKHGGATRAVGVAQAEIEAARSALAAAGHGKLPYARVDMVRAGGRLLVVELELTEPVLFLSHSERAAGLFAGALLESAGGNSASGRVSGP